MLKFLTVIAVAFVILMLAVLEGHAAPVPPGRENIAKELIKVGEAALAQDDASLALQKFESALVADPKNTSAYIGLGQSHEKLARPKSAMEQFETALEIDPNNLKALELQSLGYLKLGKLSAAESNLSRLKRLCAHGCAELDHVDEAIANSLMQTEKALLAGMGTSLVDPAKQAPDNPKN